jgi:hypothetical protein
MENTIITATNEPAILIEPKDLRIGNALYYNNKPVSVTFLSLDIDDEYNELIGFVEWGKNSNETMDWNRSLLPDLKPIPLTPEILEKCGFVPFVDSENIFELETDNNLCYLRKEDNGFRPAEPVDGDAEFITIGIKIQYLHQLQNLYFALTGEELQINL